MYIPTPYFRNVPKMGDLTLDNIFLDDGYPVLFTCTNEEKLYLCLCRTVVDEQKWVISEISIYELESLIKNQISLYDAFKSGSGYACIARWKNGSTREEYAVMQCRMLSEKELPNKKVFLDDEEESLDYLNRVKNRMEQRSNAKHDAHFESSSKVEVSVSHISINTSYDSAQRQFHKANNFVYMQNYDIRFKSSSLGIKLMDAIMSSRGGVANKDGGISDAA